jgi:lipopolysaccharide exporter
MLSHSRRLPRGHAVYPCSGPGLHLKPMAVPEEAAPSNTPTPSLSRRIATGATWMILQRLAVRGIGLVSTMILARLLIPADFGIVALATSLAALLDALFEFGFDLALIHRQTTERKHYDSAWTLSVLRGVITALLLLAIAKPMGALYDDPRLVTVMMWLAVATLASGFQNVGIVEFRRELQFDAEFQLLVRSKVVAFIVTIGLAWYLRDYRALVAGIIAGKLTGLVLSYTMHPFRPWFSLASGRDFLHFSKWLCLDNIVTAIKTRSDTFFVGKIAGADALGFYALAYEISNLTSTELVAPISRVLFPGFAKLAGDRERLAWGFVQSLAMIVFIAAPMAAGIAMVSDYVVAIFLGPRWQPVVPLIQILTLYGLFNLTLANGAALYLSLGRPDLIVSRNLPSIAVLIPALAFGVWKFGTTGAAWALVLSAVVSCVVNFALLHQQLRISFAALCGGVWRPLVAASGMAGLLFVVKGVWPMGDSLPRIIPQVAVLATFGAIVYAVLVLALWLISGRPTGAERRVLDLAASVIAKGLHHA